MRSISSVIESRVTQQSSITQVQWRCYKVSQHKLGTCKHTVNLFSVSKQLLTNDFHKLLFIVETALTISHTVYPLYYFFKFQRLLDVWKSQMYYFIFLLFFSDFSWLWKPKWLSKHLGEHLCMFTVQACHHFWSYYYQLRKPSIIYTDTKMQYDINRHSQCFNSVSLCNSLQVGHKKLSEQL